LYKKYADKNILERYYEAMVKWHEFSKKSAAGSKIGDARYIWDTKFHFGDWMLPSIMMGSDFKGPMETAKPTKEVMATAYLAHTSELLANVAKVLEKPEATEFLNYSKNVKRVFNQHFMKKTGRFEADFQGPYTVALAFKLLSEVNQKLAIKRLVELIEANGNRLDTGFLSINYLLDVLCDYGHKDLALKVFHQDRCPSWFYEIKKGATTIWESWAAIKPDGTVGKYSFNHFAYGCVGDWIVRKIGGLELKKPGFKEFYATPFFDPSLRKSELTYKTIHGLIEIKYEELEFEKKVSIKVPPMTKCYLRIFYRDAEERDAILEQNLLGIHRDGFLGYHCLAGTFKLSWKINKYK